MTDLAGTVLPMVRTRADLHRWSDANRHGSLMHEGVDILEAASKNHDPEEIFVATSKALASSITVIARSDDSSGIIGDACRRLLELHPLAAARASVPVAPLVKWMIKWASTVLTDIHYLGFHPGKDVQHGIQETKEGTTSSVLHR